MFSTRQKEAFSEWQTRRRSEPQRSSEADWWMNSSSGESLWIKWLDFQCWQCLGPRKLLLGLMAKNQFGSMQALGCHISPASIQEVLILVAPRVRFEANQWKQKQFLVSFRWILLCPRQRQITPKSLVKLLLCPNLDHGGAETVRDDLRHVILLPLSLPLNLPSVPLTLYLHTVLPGDLCA